MHSEFLRRIVTNYEHQIFFTSHIILIKIVEQICITGPLNDILILHQPINYYEKSILPNAIDSPFC